MRKLLLLLLFLITLIHSADVKPFYFEGIPEAEQQNTWDELMKYKLWGTEYFSVGNGVIVPDESGRNGTNGNLKGTGSETLLGGPIIVIGDINVGNGYTFPTGPTVANSFTMGNLNNGYFGGTVCLADTSNVSQQFKQGLTKGGGELTSNCNTLPNAVGLSIPSVVWPDSELHAINVPMHGTGYIDVPAGEGSYDIYLSGITMDQESKLYIRMPDEGRLTRIFVNGKITLSNHAVIQTMNGSTIVSNDDYGGNLMFYTTEDLTFSNTDYCIRQGTYISAKTFRMVSNVTFAGQLLGNELVIGDNVDGKNFLYVPFDPPIINLGDPKTNALGNFVENNKDVEVPIFLDTLAPGKVSFNYCFILNDDATEADFNIENYPIKVCGKDSGLVIINEGNSVPTVPVIINVKDDGIVEGTEVVGLKIYNVSGAALPGNKKTHVFTLTLSDGDLFKINTDGLAKDVPENVKDLVIGKVNVLGGDTATRFTIDNPRYVIDSVFGIITLNEAYDYEQKQLDTIKIIAKDSTKSDTVNYIINVLDENELPLIEAQEFKFSENSPIPTIIGTVKWTDLDVLNKDFQNNEIVLLYSSDPNISVSKDGTITSSKIFDYETDKDTIELKIKVQDKNVKSLSDTANIIIVLTNVNEDIKATATFNEVIEGPIGTNGVIGTIVGKDGDSTKVSYKLTDSTKTFVIDSNGVITAVKDLDYETKNKYPISITLESTDGSILDTSFVIDVQNVNEPVHVRDTSLVVKENHYGVIGKVEAYDEDGDKISYTISDTIHYSISDGKITLKIPFDYEQTKEDTVNVIVSDGKLKDTAQIIIKIENENEGIVAETDLNPINENEPIGTIVGTIAAKDSDNVEVKYYINDKTNFKIDSLTGTITTNNTFNFEEKSEYPIIITVKSKDGDSLKIKETIKVNDVNEAPELKEIKLSIDENKTGVVGTIPVIDEDKNIKFNENVLSMIDGDTSKFELDGNKVIVKIPLDYEKDSTYSIKISVKDKNDPTLIDTMTYEIKVNNVNERPTVDDLSINVDENYIGLIDTLKAKDPDGDKLTYTVDNPNLKIDTNGIISVIKPFDYEKDSLISVNVIVKDPSGLADTSKIKIKVNDVNEPHKVNDETLKIPEDIKTPTPIDTIDVIDPDLYPDHKFELIDTTNTFKIDSNGVISVVKPIDYETKKDYEVKVIVYDDKFADTATIKINVLDVVEKGNLDIIKVETRDSVISGPDLDEPIYTNNDKVDITYKTEKDKKDTTFDNLKEGKNEIEICYDDPTKNIPGCDTVIIYYSKTSPVITVATVEKMDGKMNGQTIVDEPDGNQYVNTKTPDIQVMVKDPVDPKNDTTFTISVDLHTIDVPAKVLTNKTIEPIENVEDIPSIKVNHEVIDSTGKIKVTYYDEVAQATVSYVTDSTGKRIDKNFTVEYVVTITDPVTKKPKEVSISYTTDSFVEVKSNYTISYKQVNRTDTIKVSYNVNEDGIIQKKDDNVGYTISYSYTNKYGNTGTSEVAVILDMVVPKVKIISPNGQINEVFYTNSVDVLWTVDDIEQDTLRLERLEKGLNQIVRCYMDKANNISCDTALVIMKNAKDIDIALVHPVTEINKDKVDSFYNAGGKYDAKKPFQVLIQDPNSENLPEPVGIGLKIDLVLPSLSSTGGVATLDDVLQTINGQTGIIVNKDGELINGTSTGADGSYTIPVETYIENHCTDEFKNEVKQKGIEHTTIWNVKYNMRVWIYNNNSEYVNDFNFAYDFDDTAKANSAGLITFVVDWLAARDGYVKSANGNNLGTGGYIVNLETKSIATNRCELPNQKIGTKVKKTEDKMTTFGYKRPTKK